MMGLIDESAQWLVDHKRPEKPKLDGYAQTILSDIRGRSIRLNDSQKAEEAYLADTFTNYRRRLFGTLNITEKAGSSLNQFWQEMSTLYPDVFKPDISSADMPRELYSAIDNLKSMYEVQTCLFCVAVQCIKDISSINSKCCASSAGAASIRTRQKEYIAINKESSIRRAEPKIGC